MTERAAHKASRGVKTRGERVVQISRREANARLDLGDLGLEQHYLGPSHHRADICLSNARRDAIAILRPPISAAWNTTLDHPLEISRLQGNVDRTVPLSAFVAGCVRWVREHRPSTACIISYSDPGEMNPETGVAHSGGIYRAANFVGVGDAPAAEPHWIDRDGKRRNRQSVYRLLGTASRDRVAALRPRWEYVPGTPKRLFVMGMALTPDEVVAALKAVPRSARSRPFGLSIIPPSRPWE